MSKLTQTALLTSLLALLPLVSNAQGCQTASIPATTPNSQLIDNGNGTVTDTKTGLMWKQCSEGLSGLGCVTDTAQTYTWQAALQRVQDVNSGITGNNLNYTDWRLPNVKELVSIIEHQCYEPAINLTRFPNVDEIGNFWSSSPHAIENFAWGVYFGHGNSFWHFKDNAYQVRLVRSVP